MKKFIVILLIAILLSLAGCGHFSSQSGGSVTTTFSDITTSLDSNNKPIIVDKSITVVSNQPENPDTPGEINVNKLPDGSVRVIATTGSGQNIAQTTAAFDLASSLMWAGIGIVVLGGLLAIFGSKVFIPPWYGLGFAALGGTLIVLAFLLAQYAIYFMIMAAVFAIVIAGLVVRQVLLVSKSADEIVTTVELGKETGIIKGSEFDNLARKAHTTGTNKIVKKIKSL